MNIRFCFFGKTFEWEIVVEDQKEIDEIILDYFKYEKLSLKVILNKTTNTYYVILTDKNEFLKCIEDGRYDDFFRSHFVHGPNEYFSHIFLDLCILRRVPDIFENILFLNKEDINHKYELTGTFLHNCGRQNLCEYIEILIKYGAEHINMTIPEWYSTSDHLLTGYPLKVSMDANSMESFMMILHDMKRVMKTKAWMLIICEKACKFDNVKFLEKLLSDEEVSAYIYEYLQYLLTKSIEYDSINCKKFLIEKYDHIKMDK